MLIGELMRGVMRGTIVNDKMAETKSVELHPGQVVKATVLQTFSNQEALLNIDGAKVRARLEIPLKTGQTAMMQVQQDPNNIQILLKPLSVTNEVSDEAVQDLLKNLQLKDSVANRMLAQQLLSSPVPLNKEAIQQIRQVLAAQPANIPSEEWNQAIVVAHNKGVPMTEEAVRALHRVMFGQPLHASMEDLSRQLTELLNQKQTSPQAQVKLEQLSQLLMQMKTLSDQITGQNSAQPNVAKKSEATRSPIGFYGPMNTQNTPPQASQGNVQNNKQTASINSRQTEMANLAYGNPERNVTPAPTFANDGNSTGASSRNPQMAQAPQTAQTGQIGQTNQVPQTAQNLQNAQTSQPAQSAQSAQLGQPAQPGQPGQLGQTTQAPQAPQTPQMSQAAPISQSAQSAQTAQTAQIPLNQQTSASNQAATINAPITNNWAPQTPNNYVSSGAYSLQNKNGEPQIVQQLLRHMGIQTEHGLAQSVKQTETELAVQQTRQSMQQLAANMPPQPANAPGSALNPLDSFKGALMQLLSMNDMPPAMKGTVESLVQHITGQQLLMTPDKFGSFSYVTMTVPLFDQQSEGQTAEVFIQSRKGKKGQLDPKNCRLLFDLNMNAIGQTLVDVQVVDRIVNVYVMNDNPGVQSMFEISREEIATSMEGLGYQFLSLKVSDYPQSLGDLEPQKESEAGAHKLPTQNGQNYRGVDYRV